MAEIGLLEWLEQWYSAQCDGKWEHGCGIHIETLDNPGWSVEINLSGTPFAAKIEAPLKIEISEDHWIHVWISDGTFKGFGDVHRLGEIISTFRQWVEH